MIPSIGPTNLSMTQSPTGLKFDENAEPAASAKKICQLALKISRAVVVLR